MNLEIPVKFTRTKIIAALLVVVVVFSPGFVEGHGKMLQEVKKVLASPENLLSLVDDDIPSDHLNVYYRSCNKTLYDASDYKKAWDLADKNDHSGGAKLFDRFFNVGRKGRSPKWRQDVCDGWPSNLFQCSQHPKKKGLNVCLCLQTKLSKFVVADVEYEDAGGKKQMKACRVANGYPCNSKTMALNCAEHRECVSSVCGVSNSFNFFSNYFLSLFLIVMKVA